MVRANLTQSIVLQIIDQLRSQLGKKESIIKTQEYEISDLKAEIQNLQDRMQSDFYIYQRRIQDLEDKLITMKTRIIEK